MKIYSVSTSEKKRSVKNFVTNFSVNHTKFVDLGTLVIAIYRIKPHKWKKKEHKTGVASEWIEISPLKYS